MRRALFALLLAVAAATASAQAHEFPRFASAAQVESACTALLDTQRAQAQRIEQMPAEPAAALAAAFDAMHQRYEDTLGPIAVLVAVHPDKAIRDAGDACELRYQAFVSEFQQNARIYALLQQAKAADAIDERLLRELREGFEDAGAGLQGEAQARARAINDELTQRMQDFDRVLREDKTRVALGPAELNGIPRAAWAKAERDAQGRVLFGLDYPSYDAVMEHATSAAARERFWRAFQNRGGDTNLKTLARILELRIEYARLFGFASYADFVLRRRMAQRAAEVQAFLGTVKSAVAARELADLHTLHAAKARDLKTGLDRTVFHRWDLPYYTRRVRAERYRFAPDRFRRHFPPQASVDVVFRIAERLFGVQFKPVQQALWHPDAKAHAVVDGASQRVLGTLYTDLYPRDDKYGHAAVWSFRGGSTLAGRLPAAALVANLDREGLSLEEFATLLHEFGHALHTLLSNTRHALQAGTATQQDFVEAPSQMLEEWVYDPKVLALFAEVCKACRPVPPALIATADRARQFAKGVLFARQHLYASYDLALHGPVLEDPLALWMRMEGATPLGTVPGTRLPASFAHTATNYAAAYYGYLWSLVIAEDLRTAFAADRLDAAVGRRYRDTILANGGQVAPGELVQRFLGRPGDSQAFFRSLARE